VVKIDQLIRTEQVDDKRPDLKDAKRPDLRLVSAASDGGKKPKRRTLTAKQERFVQALTKGGPDGKGMSQADAYRSAYSADRMSSHAVHCEASLLAAHPEVSARVAVHRQAVERSTLTSALTRRRWIVERLEHEAKTAEGDAARIRALELLGKVSDVALFTDRVEHVDSDRSPDEVREELEQRLLKLVSDSQSP
jgi:hypothetical protein